MRRYLLVALITILFILALPASNKIYSVNVGTEGERIYGRLALVITFDALNYTVLNRALSSGDLPNFKWLIDNGYMILGKTIVPSATTAAWAAFGTGVPPEINGVVYTYAVNTTNYREIPIDEEPSSVGWKDMIHSETLTEVLNRHMIKFGFVYTESKVAVFFGKNGSPTVPVYLPEPYDPHDPALPIMFRAEYVESLVNSTISIIDSFYEYIKAGERALVMLDFPEPDSSGHTHGPGSSYYYEMLKILDTQIGRIISYLRDKGLWDRTLLIMFTDHSMLDVDPELNVMTPDKKHIVGLPIEHRAVGGGTLVYIYLKDLNQIPKAVSYLKNLSWVAGIWTRIPVEGVNGTLHDLYLNTTYAGDIVLSIKKPYYAYPGWVSRGAHGGVNTLDVPFIFSGGMLKNDINLSNVTILDMAPTLAGYLGVEKPANATGRDLEIYKNFIDLAYTFRPKVAQPGDSIKLNISYSFRYSVSNAKLEVTVDHIDKETNTTEKVYSKTISLNETEDTIVLLLKFDKEGTYEAYIKVTVDNEVWLETKTSLMIISMKAAGEEVKLTAAWIIAIVLGVITIITPIALKRMFLVKKHEE